MNSRIRINDVCNNHILIETEPGYRTIFVTNASSPMKITRLLFPWVYHHIFYDTNKKNNKIFYPRLSVFFKKERLSSLEEDFYISPTERDVWPICLPHKYELIQTYTIEDMAKKLLAIWWGLTHMINPVTLNNWKNSDNYLNHKYTGIQYFSHRIGNCNLKLIDEDLGLS